jgi:hypothetical protein
MQLTLPTLPTSSPLNTVLAGFSDEAEIECRCEREAIQWVESLSSEQGDAVVAQAIAEWNALVQCTATGDRVVQNSTGGLQL